MKVNLSVGEMGNVTEYRLASRNCEHSLSCLFFRLLFRRLHRDAVFFLVARVVGLPLAFQMATQSGIGFCSSSAIRDCSETTVLGQRDS
jgi:hypothetical protein